MVRGSSGRKLVDVVEQKSWQESVADGAKRLKLVEDLVFGTNAEVFFGTGVITNVMPATICSQLHLQPHGKNRRMKMADGSETRVLGEVEKLQLRLEGGNFRSNIWYKRTFYLI